ncbi:MAG: 16S rRNA (cytosine(1402)-N(4))-methyltransferase RsmH [Oscillospiraceae bacterium]|nr:16S rRNA (cytosine(1402)-N(4))-methyltransferase RsmH [Oscillospiraceae bacterium]
MFFSHKTVLLHETIDLLAIKPDGIYVDGTAGGGGASFEIAKRLSKFGKLISIDIDPDAVSICYEKLCDFENVLVLEANFAELVSLLNKNKINKIDGILLDLGMSSYQIDNLDRGFSYINDAPLDMRMSKSGLSAADLLISLNESSLADLIFKFGEERFAKKIAHMICIERKRSPIKTTLKLSEIVKKSVPNFSEMKSVKRVFQAFRIAVNSELENLKTGLKVCFEVLKNNARLAVISFHSLEDKIIKQEFNFQCQDCICPRDFPICSCGKNRQAKLITKKAVRPSTDEILKNPRCKSAKLRVCEKLEFLQK